MNLYENIGNVEFINRSPFVFAMSYVNRVSLIFFIYIFIQLARRSDRDSAFSKKKATKLKNLRYLHRV